MLSKEKIRKADLFTGLLIVLLGLWIVYHAFQMPMKESYGGVQNVWYVSPALFPLITGVVLVGLGVMLTMIAIKTVGKGEVIVLIKSVISKVTDRDSFDLAALRFFSIISCFVFFIFMNVPRVDFIICSTLFLVVFIQTFYPDDTVLIKRLTLFYFLGSLLFIGLYVFGMAKMLQGAMRYSMDLLNIGFIVTFILYSYRLMRNQPELMRKFKIGMIVALIVPWVLGSVFKYRLLVPLPYEGMIAEFMDYLVYDAFES